MKNNKGLNLIALIVTIIVMIIIASIALNAAINDQEKANEAKRLTEKGQVAKAIEIRYANYTRNSAHYPIIGQKIPEHYSSKEDIKEYIIDTFLREQIIANANSISDELDAFLDSNMKYMEYTRILKRADIVALELENVTLKSVFIVNYYTGKVIGPIF